MIGTTFKLGFDGVSVGKGLSNLGRQVGAFGKQIGIGMARQVGARMTDTLGRILSAVPESLAETTDWAGNLVDMSNATGTSVKKLVELEEMLRLTGVEANDTAAMISKMAANIEDAATVGGPAADALLKIGLVGEDLRNMDAAKQFETIGKALAGIDPKQMGNITADIFGGKMGYKLLRLFTDFEASSAQARHNVEGLAKAMDGGLAVSVDRWGDAMGRFETFKRSLGTIAIDEIMRKTGGAGGPDAFFDFLDPEKARKPIRQIMEFIENQFKMIGEKGFIEYYADSLRAAGKILGQGIKEGMFTSGKSNNQSSGGFWNSIKEYTTGQDTTSLIKESNTLLAAIRERVGIAKFA